jgi:homopolymeric O-antigen transport system permease protein
MNGSLATRTLRIEPPRAWQAIDLPELWRYRELLYFFVWRDIKVRYKQTVLGAAWAIIQPLSTTFLFTVIFGVLGGMSKQVQGPYALHVFVGLLPWTFFANAVNQSASSLVGSGHLISKVYFPRILVPFASIVGGLIDFAISFAALLALMAFYGVWPTARFVVLPLFLIGTIAASAGTGLLFAALLVTYRDFRYVVGFAVQLWLYATPVLYSLDIIPERWRLWYAINPMAGMIAGFRAAVLGGPWQPAVIAVSAFSALVFFVVGARYFMNVERRFADVI